MIIIKDMEMPKGYFECYFSKDGFCSLTELMCLKGFTVMRNRPSSCPLEEVEEK